MRKRNVILSLGLAVVLTMGAFLSGCGKSNDTNAAANEGNTLSKAEQGEEGTEPEKGGKITIFQQKTEIYDQLKALAAEYQTETGVEVEVWQISGDDYYQNLKTYLSSESGPTVFSLNSAAEISEVGAYLEDIGDLSFLSKIEGDLLAKIEGRTVGIPMTAEGFGLVYNKSMISKDEINSAEALVSFIEEEAADGIHGLGLSSEAYFLIGQILNTPFAVQDDPAAFCQSVYSGEVNIADVKEFQELASVFEAIRKNQKNPLEVSYDENCGDFATGKAAMIHQGNWCYSLFESYDVDFDMDIMGLPIGGNSSIAVGVPSVWSINTDAAEDEKKLAKDFLEWLYTSETGTRYLTQEFGFIPVVDGMVSDSLDPVSQAVAAAIADGNIIPWTFNVEWPAGAIVTYLAPVAEEFFTSDMTGEKFLETLNEAFVSAEKQ